MLSCLYISIYYDFFSLCVVILTFYFYYYSIFSVSFNSKFSSVFLSWIFFFFFVCLFFFIFLSSYYGKAKKKDVCNRNLHKINSNTFQATWHNFFPIKNLYKMSFDFWFFVFFFLVLYLKLIIFDFFFIPFIYFTSMRMMSFSVFSELSYVIFKSEICF